MISIISAFFFLTLAEIHGAGVALRVIRVRHPDNLVTRVHIKMQVVDGGLSIDVVEGPARVGVGAPLMALADFGAFAVEAGVEAIVAAGFETAWALSFSVEFAIASK